MYVLNVDLNMGQITAELQLLQLLPLFSLILCFPTAKFLFHFILLHSTNEIKPEFHQSLFPLGHLASIFDFPACPFLALGQHQGTCRSTSVCLQEPGRRSKQSTPLLVEEHRLRVISPVLRTNQRLLSDLSFGRGRAKRKPFRQSQLSSGSGAGLFGNDVAPRELGGHLTHPVFNNYNTVLGFGLKFTCCFLYDSSCFFCY